MKAATLLVTHAAEKQKEEEERRGKGRSRTCLALRKRVRVLRSATALTVLKQMLGRKMKGKPSVTRFRDSTLSWVSSNLSRSLIRTLD